MPIASRTVSLTTPGHRTRDAELIPRQLPLVVTERSYTPTINGDRHPFVQVVLARRGRLDMQVGDVRGFSGETRFALVPHEVEHRYWATGANRFLVLDLSTAMIEDVQRNLEHSASLPDDPFPVVGEKLLSLGSLLRAELAGGGLDEPLIAETLGHYAASLLLQPFAGPAPMSPSSTATRRLARLTRDYLDASYAEPLAIGQIAATVGASASHVQRAFRAHHGATIVAYVRARRLDHAKTLLLETDLSITEVAFAAGFHDLAYFTRTFTRDVGIPPSRFRQATRAESDKRLP